MSHRAASPGRPTRGSVPPTSGASTLIGLVLATVALFQPAGVSADPDALARIPLPPGARSAIVSTNLVQNGMRTSIATLEPAGSVTDALAFYRGAWAEELDGHPGFIENEAGGWSIVSRLEDDESLVVQLRDGPAGAEGFLSAFVIVPAQPSGAPVPLPSGGRRVSTTSVQDIGSSADTTIVSAPGRPAEIVAFYRDRFTRDGWDLVSERPDDGSHVLMLQRSDRRLELVVVDGAQGGSMAILNEVRER